MQWGWRHFEVWTQRQTRMGRCYEETLGGKGGRLRAGGGGLGQIARTSEGPALLTATLISDSRTPELGEDTRVPSQPRSWGSSATTALGHS